MVHYVILKNQFIMIETFAAMKLKLQNWIFKLQCEFFIGFFYLYPIWGKILIWKKKQKLHFQQYYYGYSFNSFQPSVAFHIKNSHLIWTANQKTSFYMKWSTGLKWVELNIYYFTYKYFELIKVNISIYIYIFRGVTWEQARLKAVKYHSFIC